MRIVRIFLPQYRLPILLLSINYFFFLFSVLCLNLEYSDELWKYLICFDTCIILTDGVKNENVHSHSPYGTVYLPDYGLIPTEMYFCFSYLLYDQTAAWK